MNIKKYENTDIEKENKKGTSQRVEFSEKQSELSRAKEVSRKKSGAIVGLSIACTLLGLTTTGLAISVKAMSTNMNNYGSQLENIYQRNYYDLVNSVNNADTEVSKILNSSSQDLQKKFLQELSQDAKNMQMSLSSLPITSSEMERTVRFVNQLSGYCDTLAEKDGLSNSDMESLAKIHENLSEFKDNINGFSKQFETGYNILSQSRLVEGSNKFTYNMVSLRNVDSEVPTMIYDGPFSDSTIKKEVKGLSGDLVSRETCFKEIEKLYNNIQSLDYSNETNGLFQTYNFVLTNTDNQKSYIQMTKQGGNVLTISGNNKTTNSKLNEDDAIKIAKKFASENGIENAECVWSQKLDGQMYLNLAPVQDGIVLYPDLVKVKVDLSNGAVIGYDSSSYFMNHVKRDLSVNEIGKIPSSKFSGYNIVNFKKVLAPLDYNREVLCYEYECEKDGSTYYFYFNMNTGVEENILKVLKTDEGNKLM